MRNSIDAGWNWGANIFAQNHCRVGWFLDHFDSPCVILSPKVYQVTIWISYDQLNNLDQFHPRSAQHGPGRIANWCVLCQGKPRLWLESVNNCTRSNLDTTICSINVGPLDTWKCSGVLALSQSPPLSAHGPLGKLLGVRGENLGAPTCCWKCPGNKRDPAHACAAIDGLGMVQVRPR
jgi:hypothetical protein